MAKICSFVSFLLPPISPQRTKQGVRVTLINCVGWHKWPTGCTACECEGHIIQFKLWLLTKLFPLYLLVSCHHFCHNQGYEGCLINHHLSWHWIFCAKAFGADCIYFRNFQMYIIIAASRSCHELIKTANKFKDNMQMMLQMKTCTASPFHWLYWHMIRSKTCLLLATAKHYFMSWGILQLWL